VVRDVVGSTILPHALDMLRPAAGWSASSDFLCYPDFGSPTVFAALLDDEKGGRFVIQPQLSKMGVRQLYLTRPSIVA
jgi:hypothetical protein